MVYITRFGGDKYIFLTDLLAVIYSFLAIVTGVYAVRMYSLKSMQGKALFLIVLGITSWFLAELIWIIFFPNVRYYCEFLRFFGYIPLTAAFFSILPISDPVFRRHGKKFIYLFILFLVASITYLNILPVVFGGASLLENILNNGYIVADFVLLFGILLLLRTSFIFKKGSLSLGWLIFAIAFMAAFIFDIYFAFNFSSYLFGDLIEIFWLLPYMLLCYGFFYHYQAMKDFLKPFIGEKKPKKKGRKMLVMIIITIAASLLLLYLLLSFVILPSSQEQKVIYQYKDYWNFTTDYRYDVYVVFTKEVFDMLNKEYSTNSGEYLFCLIGNKTNNEIYVNDLVRPELFYQGEDIVISHEDPACQIENSLGSIHSHSGSCKPSLDDIFSWGEMKNPEPIINAIQCNSTIYIVLMSMKHEALDFRSVIWTAVD